MWVTWTVIAWFMVVTKRYAKYWFNMSHALHAFMGILILFFTLAYSFKALADLDWNIE